MSTEEEHSVSPEANVNVDDIDISMEDYEEYFRTEGGELVDEKTDSETDEESSSSEKENVKGATRVREKEGRAGANPEAVEEQSTARVKALEAKIEELSKLIEKSKTPEKKVEEEEDHITYEEYPLEYLRKKIESLEKGLNTKSTEITQELQTQRQVSACKAAVSEFQSKVPDYSEAYNFLADNRAKEYAARGFSDEQIGKMLAEDVNQLAVEALAAGKNPAEILYNLAKVRGYAPKSAQKPTPNPGKAKAKSLSSLSSSGGNTEESDLSIEEILTISDPIKFKAAMKKLENKYS